MTCKDCIHENVCNALIKSGCPYLDEEVPADAFCIEFRNTADVVPKSEVEKLKIAYEGSQKTIKGLTEMIREKNKELAKLETHLELHYGEKSLNNLIAEERADVAREIFEEIERFLYMHFRFCKEEIGNDDTKYFEGRLELNTQIQNFIAELKKKYIGENEDDN